MLGFQVVVTSLSSSLCNHEPVFGKRDAETYDALILKLRQMQKKKDFFPNFLGFGDDNGLFDGKLAHLILFFAGVIAEAAGPGSKWFTLVLLKLYS